MPDSSAHVESAEAVCEKQFSKAEELLDFLNPRQLHWNPSPDGWIFRGQSEDWPLKAKAHRDGPWFDEFGLPLGSHLKVAERHWIGDVQQILAQFSHELDNAGLQIPAPAPKTSGHRRQRPAEWEPGEDALPTLALAQHHGLPTPWLDWSLKPRSAAYFACADLVWAREPGVGANGAATEERADKPGNLVIWCMRSLVESLSTAPATVADDVAGVWLTLESAPRAGNARLHAQSGLFTWLHGAEAHAQTVDGHVQAMFTRLPAGPPHFMGMAPPIMYKLSLDRLEAHRLLRLLAYEGVSGATIWPDYDGVVRAMRERAWFEHRKTISWLRYQRLDRSP